MKPRTHLYFGHHMELFSIGTVTPSEEELFEEELKIERVPEGEQELIEFTKRLGSMGEVHVYAPNYLHFGETPVVILAVTTSQKTERKTYAFPKPGNPESFELETRTVLTELHVMTPNGETLMILL